MMTGKHTLQFQPFCDGKLVTVSCLLMIWARHHAAPFIWTALSSACFSYIVLELLYHFQYWQTPFASQISVLLQPFPSICLSFSPFLLLSCGSPYLLLFIGIATALLSHSLRCHPCISASLWQCISNYFLTSDCLPSVCLSRYHCQPLKFIVAKNVFPFHVLLSMLLRCITLIFPSLQLCTFRPLLNSNPRSFITKICLSAPQFPNPLYHFGIAQGKVLFKQYFLLGMWNTTVWVWLLWDPRMNLQSTSRGKF